MILEGLLSVLLGEQIRIKRILESKGNKETEDDKCNHVGMHTHDELQLSAAQCKLFMGVTAGDLFPEYYALRVNDFDQAAVTLPNKWITFLKTGEMPDDATAAGLPEAREQLRRDKLSQEELAAYKRHLEAERYHTHFNPGFS